MKKFIHVFTLILFACVATSKLKAQSNCAQITVEVLPASPQTGTTNRFGAKVTLDRIYDQDITVIGYLEVNDGPNQSNLSITVPAGQLSVETGWFFETDPTAEAEAVITSITPASVTSNGVTYGTQAFSGNCLSLTAQNLASDADFAALAALINTNLSQFASMIGNVPDSSFDGFSQQIQYYTTQSQLNAEQTSDFSNLLGYQDVNLFASFVNESTNLIGKIRNRFPVLQSGDVGSAQTTIVSAYRILYMLDPDDLCSDILGNCKTGAHAVYTGEALACTGTAIGVGAVTFGLGGIIFQLACGATAYWHYTTMIKGCNLDYQKCIR